MTTQNLQVLRAALSYASGEAMGWPVPVFPTDGKKPLAGSNGWKDETTDQVQIKRWFAHGYNLALRPMHLKCIVIDADIGHDPRDLAGLPPTYTVRTPSGGRHFYYETTMRFGNRRWAPKIDTRNAAGYVLIPPSAGYTVETDIDPAPLPDFAVARLSIAPEKLEKADTPSVDLPDHARLRQVLARVNPADHPSYDEWAAVLAMIAGSGGDADLALEWSSGRLGGYPMPPNYCGDGYDMEAKMATFQRTGEGAAGFGSLMRLAYPKHDTPTTDAEDDEPDTAEWWMKRPIPKLTTLIGPISTHSRVQLHAPTGAGKTHVGMAISAAVASGVDWMHWHVPAAKTVLYVDGEMPKALMKERVEEAVGRLPSDINLGGRWVLKSSADYYIPPLNTQAGQKWVDDRIEAVKPDLVVFDNIQALTTGDMKETESWRAVQAWTRTITARGIAQIWVHHANKDGTAYGDKTREYQMDTVISLKPIEDATDGVSVIMTFPKKREHHPGRNDRFYATGRVQLTDVGWQFMENSALQIELIEIALGKFAEIQPTLSTKELIARMVDLGDERKPDTIKHDLNRGRNSRYGKYIVAGSSPVQWALP